MSTSQQLLKRAFVLTVAGIAALLVGGCAATVTPVIPTERPTVTPSATASPTTTADANIPPTDTPPPAPPTGGPSPTPLFGATRTPSGDEPTNTPPPNPNAPRIEFFTSADPVAAPGSTITLFWSARGADRAVIYRLDRSGERTLVWNVGPDGNMPVQTRASDRGQVDFLLIVGDGPSQVEQSLSIPLACPVAWFFDPPLEQCPDDEAEETFLIEQTFERGRMIFVGARNRVYVLFNDGFTPAWVSFENRYDPAQHPEILENLVPPPGFYQPIARLGFVWRGNDTVRNRLGLGINPELVFDGYIQTVTSGSSAELYISSADASVLNIVPGGEQWRIITLP
jgi:hypothetical protein